MWVAEWVCKGWYWISNWVCKAWHTVVEWVCIAWHWIVIAVCIAWAWVARTACTIWAWIAKWVCVAWTNAVCWLLVIVRSVRRRRHATAGSPGIKHVFVLMLENRSFDHMLGFARLSGTDPATGAPTDADDLRAGTHFNIDPADPTNQVLAASPADFAISTADKDPPHEFLNALEQLAGPGARFPDPVTNGYPAAIDNSGFISAYRGAGSPDPAKIMNCFAPRQLPVLTALAREFAVCDRWFSALPGPTWPNRFFAHAASSGGLDDSPSGFEVATSTLVDGYRFWNGTIFDRLEAACIDWEIFEGDEFPVTFALSGMDLYALDGHFTDFEDFRTKISDPDYAPRYVFIEPNYGNVLPTTKEDFTCGNSQHPLDDITRGERLIKDVYEALRGSPHWESSLLVVTYDEHGGFYDHVRPPGAVAPGDPISDPDNDHHHFDFRQLGVRVPAVVISPYVKRGTIDHTTYDHSSIPATVERLFGLAALTARDAAARDVLHLLQLARPRTDTPVTLPEPADSGFVCTSDAQAASVVAADPMLRRTMAQSPVPAPLKGFLHVSYRKRLETIPIADQAARQRLTSRFTAIRTELEAREFIHESRTILRALRRSGRPLETIRRVESPSTPAPR
ncbi:alkaline phosphatase family protein [Reyranella sp.]|uniref:alkaline phosphatase family protein n=1 Tax=Reyranella sp. TaxID=1929291 RepID=UPI002F928B59